MDSVTMNKPLFFLFAATLFLSSFLLFGVQSSLTDESLSLLLAELRISPAVARVLFTIGRAALVPMLGFALAVAIKRLCPWRTQLFVYLFLWAQCFLGFLLLIPNKPGPGSAPGLTWMVVGVVSVLGCTNLALLPSWFLAVQRADDPDMSGNYAYLLLAFGFIGGLFPFVAFVFDVGYEFWKVLHGAIVVLLAVLVIVMQKTKTPVPVLGDETRLIRPRFVQWFRWVVLSCVAWCSGFAFVTYITVNVSPIPMLSLVPQMLFLFALALAFLRLDGLRSGELIWSGVIQVIVAIVLLASFRQFFLALRIYGDTFLPYALGLTVLFHLPHRFTLVLQTVVSFVAVLMFVSDVESPMWTVFYLHLAAFWLSCWGLVGLIARSRPLAAFIPEFLICIVFGILVGTIVSSWLAPIIFPGPVLEYPLFLILACILRFLPAPLSVNRSQMRICA